MNARDRAYVDLCRAELRAAEARRRALLAQVSGAETRRKLLEAIGGTTCEIEEHGAAARALALQKNEEVIDLYRRMIAAREARVRIQAHRRTVSAPVRARSDEAALFELLASCGGRMPEAGAQ